MESGLFAKRLSMVFDNLTATEELLAKYIGEHSGELRAITSSELAGRLGIAQSTVIKFSQKLGYSSFKRMINDLSTDMADAEVNEEIDFGEDDDATLRRLGMQYQNMFELTASLNRISSYREAVDYLYAADTIVAFGYTSRKEYQAEHFVSRLLKMGLNAFTNTYTAEVYAKIDACKPGDVVLLLSDTGETRETLNFAKIARKRGMKVISITRLAQNRLADLSDVNLKVVEYGNRTVMRNVMITYTYSCVLDMLYLCLFKRDPERFQKNTARNSIITKLNYIEP